HRGQDFLYTPWCCRHTGIRRGKGAETDTALLGRPAHPEIRLVKILMDDKPGTIREMQDVMREAGFRSVGCVRKYQKFTVLAAVK
ncbi:MAG: hypothetical protein PHT99_07085, partial [Methanoregula sp.]|nr:hypothetical protein [Methanoregula sp.]